jgi:hypothetical protein
MEEQVVKNIINQLETDPLYKTKFLEMIKQAEKGEEAGYGFLASEFKISVDDLKGMFAAANCGPQSNCGLTSPVIGAYIRRA